MSYLLLHHTGCGTSRKGLALLEENGVQPKIRKYMNQSEQLSEDELREIATQMGAASPREFLRTKDAVKFALPEDADDDTVFAAMADNPRLIQRPIGINRGKAALGRPIEQLLDIL
jgi:arsenate reductase